MYMYQIFLLLFPFSVYVVDLIENFDFGMELENKTYEDIHLKKIISFMIFVVFMGFRLYMAVGKIFWVCIT